MPNPYLYLIDVSGLCYRAYYALPSFATSYGQPTGAVFGFINILNKILKNNPEYVACCFDISRDTFRQKKFSEYKVNRPQMPDELASQMQLIREVVSAYNIVISQQQGYEADDVIASLAHKAAQQSLEVRVVSSDKDILQLVDENVKVFDPKKDKEGLLYDAAQVKLKYGVEPHRLVDIFSLTGDAVDNIPGIKGIGEKTALALIQEFASLEGLLNNSEKIKSPSLKSAIRDNIHTIRLNQELLKLTNDIDIDFDLSALKRKPPDYDALFELFKKLEFKSLLNKLPMKKDTVPQEAVKAKALEAIGEKEYLFQQIQKENEFLFLIDKGKERIIFSSRDIVYSLTLEDAQLHKILVDPYIRKISHNLKEAKRILLERNVEIEGLYFDTMIAAYILEPSLTSFSLEELAFRYFHKHYAQDYLIAEEALGILIEIIPLLAKKLKENSLDKLFYELEMPLVSVLASMESAGVRIDVKALHALSKELEKKLIQLRQDIYALNSGDEFNLNSPKQLAEVLFTKLKLPIVKKTKTGVSTDEEVLRKLSSEHHMPLLILEYRSITKLKSTYVDSLPELIDAKTRRIHAAFDHVGTETGRLSSENPNLQNIPVRGDIASLIRKAFIAEDGFCLVSADYSQIELRDLAYFSGDDNLIAAFMKDLDIHRHTASLIFQVDEASVSDEMRATAKRINFGIIYGMSSFGLSKDLGIPPQEAQIFIDNYFLRYPKVREFIEAQIKSARQLGYAKTLLGRRRYLSEMHNKNNAIRSFAERQAVNSPIQGSAADLIKLAMVNIHRQAKERKLKSKILMQIHDELVFEVLHKELQEMIALIRNKMENAYTLNVPIKVNIKQGANWLEMEQVK